MARLWSSGAELNSTTANVEVTSVSGSGGATATVDATTFRSGVYSFRSDEVSPGSSTFLYSLGSTTGINKHVYARIYIRIASAPGANQFVLRFTDSGGARLSVQLTTGLVLKLLDDGGSQVGSDSAALNTGQWYRVEAKCDMTTSVGNVIGEALLDGTSFASDTWAASAGVNEVRWGAITNTTGYEYYFDDIAINDSSGSFQNSWPGEGEIIHLRPNAAGDNTAWLEGTGTSFAEVDEVTPDDDTSYIQEDAADAIADFNLDATPAALASDDTINVVQVGARFESEGGTSSNSTFVLRVKAAAAGTVEESATITPDTTAWVTNAIAAPRNYPLTLYDLPGASTTAWTKDDLDTAQIGARIVTDDFWDAKISTLWLLVDHKPGEGATEQTKTYTTDAILKTILTKTYTTDGVIVQRKTKTLTLDAVIKAIIPKTYSLDSVVKKTESEVYTADGLLEKTQSVEYTLDGRVKEVKEKTYTIDGVIKEEKTTTHTQDAVVQKTTTYAFTTDALIQESKTKPYTVDSVVQQQQSESYTLDSIIKQAFTKTYTQDALLKQAFTETYEIDGVLKQEKTEVFTLDGILQTAGIKFYGLDGTVKEIKEENYSLDSVVRKTSTKDYLINAIAKKTLTTVYTTDALTLASQGVTSAWIMDALVTFPEGGRNKRPLKMGKSEIGGFYSGSRGIYG